MIYQGISGTIYEIGERLAGGGEGSIYAIEKNDLQVAKIFKSERRNAQREEKLRLMVLKKLEEKQLQQITWPQDVIALKNMTYDFVCWRQSIYVLQLIRFMKWGRCVAI